MADLRAYLNPFPSARVWRALLVASVVALMACGGDPTEPDRYAPAERLEGTWRWISSLDVNTGEVHTPTQTGFEAELTFVAESDREGGFVYRKTGAPELNGSFGIGYEDFPGNDFLVLDRPIDFLESHAWVAAGPDSLWLGGAMEGGYNSRYVRIPDGGSGAI